MILVKKNIDGKEVYEPITFEDASKYPNKDDLIFTDKEEKKNFEKSKVKENKYINKLLNKIEDLLSFMNDLTHEDKASTEMRLNEIKEELNDLENLNDEYLEEKLDSLDDELDEIEDDIDELLEKTEEQEEYKKDFGNVFVNIFRGFKNKKSSSKSNKLLAALPFMDKEDLHELVENIINNPEEYKDLQLVNVFPFLETNDCDALFLKLVVEEKSEKYNIASLAPFVSKECLSKFVDEYVNGNYQDINMSMLYPFLDSKDIKRVFKYILSKKD